MSTTSPPASPVVASADVAIPADLLVDDMHDSMSVRDLVASAPPLYAALQVIDEALLSRYEEHDQLSLSAQRRFRFVIFVTAWGGALAVLGAVAQLVFVALGMHTAAHLAEKFEALLIVLTAIGVLTGWRLAQIENWLLDRYKAEQLRLLKFRMLLDPRIWGDRAERDAWKQQLLRQRDTILSVTQRTLPIESERDVLPLLPSRADCSALDAEGLSTLLEYYRRTRIESRLGHFTLAAKRKTSVLDKPRLLPWFFLTSLLMVGGHITIEQVEQRLPWLLGDAGRFWEQTSVVLMGLAVALPVAWAGIRAWRSARESTRTVARSAARRHMLAGILPLIDRMKQVDADHALCQLQTLELVLESDQREWLRLMREVEWYV